ncbi:MAG: chemotaxis protein CheW [Limnochordia bacterium]|nr:chemotaxis protein CheW [Limnochordia bacterium]MDD2628640.1 chemotaxis protein CheW [Limnochordia bacterium]MDD4516943.1 chemotaxis protein CheW [Limnochordia bacterium]
MTEPRSQDQELQFVVFSLVDEEFAIDIMQVKEIIKMATITKLPQAPDYITGIINVRGEIIPVISLRQRFGIPRGEETPSTRIVIVESQGNLTGLIVDEVSEVLRLSQEAIEPPPQDVAGLRTEFIRGIGKIDGRILVILRLAQLLGSEEQLTIEAVRVQGE